MIGRVFWSRNGLPRWLAERYVKAGWEYAGRDWVASRDGWRYHMIFWGDKYPEVDETP